MRRSHIFYSIETEESTQTSVNDVIGFLFLFLLRMQMIFKQLQKKKLLFSAVTLPMYECIRFFFQPTMNEMSLFVLQF